MIPLSKRLMVLFVSISILIVSSAITQGAYQYGSKVGINDTDRGRPLSPFYFSPVFAFWDRDGSGTPDSNDPVYMHFNPRTCQLSENDVRITPFADNSSYYPAGSRVKIGDLDYGEELGGFGMGRKPPELEYLDVDGYGHGHGLGNYSLEDPVYLERHPGVISPGDVRITGYAKYGYLAGSRVAPLDNDSNVFTSLLPGILCFYSAHGNINNIGLAIYGAMDTVYLDTQYPFYTVTTNDIRLNGSG